MKCDCGKDAAWIYMPGGKDGNNFFCDDCVPRGCTCNYRYTKSELAETPPKDKTKWKWIVFKDVPDYVDTPEGEIWVYLDEKGRESPCCEFEYDSEGFDELEFKE